MQLALIPEIVKEGYEKVKKKIKSFVLVSSVALLAFR